MAKKEETISMIDTLAEFKELKNIDKDTMISVLEDSFRNVIAKMFGTDENYDVIINPEKGDFEIWRNRTVVADDELEDENLQLTLTEARKIDADCEVGEEVTDEVHFADFGRRAILNLRQTLASKILELQKDSLYAKYKDKSATSSPLRFIRCGRKKSCCWMTMVMSCYCRNPSKSRPISIVRERPYVRSFNVWITIITTRRSFFPVRIRSSCNGCLSWRFRRLMTA